MSSNSISIEGRRIGKGEPVYIIAELSANHGQKLDKALQLVQEAGDAGADAVKLQTYTPDTITIDSDRDYFRIRAGTVWDGRTLYDLYKEAYTPWEWHAPLQRAAGDRGLALFSSPFDGSAIDFLERLGVPAYKIASAEIVDLGLIRRAARTGKPLIVSTGMATLAEIEEALSTAREARASDVALLKCTSAYPAPPEEMNLKTIPDMERRFGVPIGLSDHSIDIGVTIAAIALGACIIEKHLTLSRSEAGPDSGFSLEPSDFREMVQQIRVAERALGMVSYEPTQHEAGSRELRRSLFVVSDIRAGERLTTENVRSIRPGHGLHTRHLDQVLGATARTNIDRGTPLSWDLIDKPKQSSS